MHRVGAAPAEAGPRRRGRRRPSASCASRGCGPTSRWPTSRRRRSPPSSWRGSLAWSRRAGRRGVAPADAARRQLGRDPRPPGRPPRHGPLRHRPVRLAPEPGRSTAAAADGLRPALSLRARVSFVKEVDAGERLSYGLRYPCRSDIGGGHRPARLRRRRDPAALGAPAGQVLIGGRRCPIAGAVTMDQIMVDCGPDADVAVGDEAVLLGRRATSEITAWEWAERTGPSPTRWCAA